MGTRKVVVAVCDYSDHYNHGCCGDITVDSPTIAEAQAFLFHREGWIFHQYKGKKVAWCGSCHKVYTQMQEAKHVARTK